MGMHILRELHSSDRQVLDTKVMYYEGSVLFEKSFLSKYPLVNLFCSETNTYTLNHDIDQTKTPVADDASI